MSRTLAEIKEDLNLSKVLLKPYLFFSEFLSKSPNMKYAFIIVLLSGYLGTGFSLISMRNIYPSDMGLIPILINLILGGFGLGLFTWVLAWIPIRLFSGMEGRYFEVAAWTLMPQCLNNLLLLILAIIFPFYVSNPEMINTGSKISPADIKGVLTSPIIPYFGYLATAWCLYILYCAVDSIGKDKKRTYLTVGASICITLGLKYLSPVLMNSNFR